MISNFKYEFISKEYAAKLGETFRECKQMIKKLYSYPRNILNMKQMNVTHQSFATVNWNWHVKKIIYES